MKTLLLSICIVFFSSNSHSQCDNLTDGGIISSDEIACGPFDPAPIQNIQSPSGGTGAIEYMWIKTLDPNNYNGTNAVPGANSITYDPPMIYETTWFVRCARRAGCSEWVGESIVKKEVSTLNVTFNHEDIGCNAQNSGTLEMTPSSGTPPFNYFLNNVIGSNVYTNLGAGTYQMMVVDDAGCVWNDSVTISVSDLSLSIDYFDDPCTSSSDFANVIISGGVPPYSIYWDNGTWGSSLVDNNGINGTYTVHVTDDNGCKASETIHFDTGDDSKATLLCCQDTVICAGSFSEVKVELDGIGPWDLEWTENGVLMAATVLQSPYSITGYPTTTTTYELVSVSTSCGQGTVCGQATIAVNDCATQSSCFGCFYSSVYDIQNIGNCVKYEIYVTPNGCQHDLSNLTISIPCGVVTEMSNSYGFTMYLQDNDPNSGLSGIKIDNISGFDQYNPMLVEFTICPDNCGNVMSCTPIFAYKAANCVYYEETIPFNDIFKMYTIHTEVTAAPNPFDDQTVIQIKYGRFHSLYGHGKVKIVDVTGRTVKNFEVAVISSSGTAISWDGTDDNGNEVNDGFYVLYYFVEGQKWAEEIKILKFQR